MKKFSNYGIKTYNNKKKTALLLVIHQHSQTGVGTPASV